MTTGPRNGTYYSSSSLFNALFFGIQVASPSLNSRNIVTVEYRGWRLKARWFYSYGSVSEGWVCYVDQGNATPRDNLGRSKTSDQALERGRRYVDRMPRNV